MPLQAVVFVIDSAASDAVRMQSLEAFHALAADEQLAVCRIFVPCVVCLTKTFQDASFVLLANKQDKAGARSADELYIQFDVPKYVDTYRTLCTRADSEDIAGWMYACNWITMSHY